MLPYKQTIMRYALHYELKQAPHPEKINLLAFHGLMGQKSNLRFLYQNPKIYDYTKNIYLLDLRNHGESPHYQDNSIASSAQDIHDFIQKQELENVCLLGHSFGARGIFEYLRQFTPSKKQIRGVIILDMLPGKLDHLDIMVSTYQMLSQLYKINLNDRIYKELQKEFSDICGDNAGFLFQNIILENEDDLQYKYTNKKLNFAWKCNISSILQCYAANFQQNIQVQWDGQALILCGQNSNYVNKQNSEEFKRFSNNKTIYIPDAGHMLHMEKPKLVLEEIIQFLSTV